MQEHRLVRRPGERPLRLGAPVAVGPFPPGPGAIVGAHPHVYGWLLGDAGVLALEVLVEPSHDLVQVVDTLPGSADVGSYVQVGAHHQLPGHIRVDAHVHVERVGDEDVVPTADDEGGGLYVVQPVADGPLMPYRSVDLVVQPGLEPGLVVGEVLLPYLQPGALGIGSRGRPGQGDHHGVVGPGPDGGLPHPALVAVLVAVPAGVDGGNGLEAGRRLGRGEQSRETAVRDPRHTDRPGAPRLGGQPLDRVVAVLPLLEAQHPVAYPRRGTRPPHVEQGGYVAVRGVVVGAVHGQGPQHVVLAVRVVLDDHRSGIVRLRVEQVGGQFDTVAHGDTDIGLGSRRAGSFFEPGSHGPHTTPIPRAPPVPPVQPLDTRSGLQPGYQDSSRSVWLRQTG